MVLNWASLTASFSRFGVRFVMISSFTVIYVLLATLELRILSGMKILNKPKFPPSKSLLQQTKTPP